MGFRTAEPGRNNVLSLRVVEFRQMLVRIVKNSLTVSAASAQWRTVTNLLG